MTFVISDETFALAKNGRIWRVSHSWTLGGAEAFHFGFAIGERDMIALSREYFTMSTGLKVELFQATWSGGTQAKTINRRLDLKDSPPPVQWYQGVTPGSLGAAITGFEIESTSSNRVGKDGDKEPFIHTAMTSYVLRVTNTGSGNQPFSFSLDFREKNPSEY
ncbi:TPA: hypothetical protein ACKPFN_003693 [Pseudomonas aeruginosa]